MASYNEINGIPVHVNPWLLGTGPAAASGAFEGFIVSDGNGISQLETLHHVAASKAEAARKALESRDRFRTGHLLFQHAYCRRSRMGLSPKH